MRYAAIVKGRTQQSIYRSGIKWGREGSRTNLGSLIIYITEKPVRQHHLSKRRQCTVKIAVREGLMVIRAIFIRYQLGLVSLYKSVESDKKALHRFNVMSFIIRQI